MIAAISLSLEEAKELSVKLWPTLSLELIVHRPDGRIIFIIVFTATDGRSTITLFTGIELDGFVKKLRITKFVDRSHDEFFIVVGRGKALPGGNLDKKSVSPISLPGR